MHINKNSLIVSGFITLFVSSLHATPPIATQLPTGGNLVGGQASITQAGAVMNINQSSDKAAISWNTFNIGRAATVNIIQPSASSVLLNQVSSTNPTQIFGHLNANGQVFLTNPNGIYFAPGASINVGGLVATTSSIDATQFMAGLTTFKSDGAAANIINDGNLHATLGGYIALMAPNVRNNGVIIAQMGTIALTAGDAYVLQFSGTTLTSVAVTQAIIGSLVENGNAIYAPGGLIILSAQAAHQIQSGVVGNTGVIDASGITNNAGVIRLTASQKINVNGVIKADAATNSIGSGGVVSIIADLGNSSSETNVMGSISARGGSLGGSGGQIETSGSRINIADKAQVSTLAPGGNAGTWTIDPTDFTIAASGGNITGTLLSAQLTSGNVAIISSTGSSTPGSGDINVNDTVNWSANELSLTAAHSINVNARMNAIGTSSLVMRTSTSNGLDNAVTGGSVEMGFNADNSFSGFINFGNRFGAGFLTVNNNAYTIINNFGNFGSTTVGDFQAIGSTGYYALGNNLIATGITTTGIAAFAGTFDGLGHTISGVNIITAAGAGLFGTVGVGSHIQNVGLVGGSLQGGVNSGGLIGWNYGTVSNTYNTGTVSSGGGGQGGLIGRNETGTVKNSYTTGNVSGAVNTGGVIGINESGLISNVFSTGNVTSAAAGAGGLVGYSTTGDIINSYSTGAVIGATGVGGLLGGGTSGNVTNSHATGNVQGTTNTGGLVGSLTSGVVSRSFSTGAVSGTTSTGGLVGLTTGAINTSYATGAVTGTTNTGGLVANSTGTVANSYATGSVTGSAGSTGGLIGITTGSTATSYSTGQVNTGSAGLIGNSTTTVTDSYFNGTLNTGVTPFGTSLSTTQMMALSSFTGFSISNAGGSTWLIYDGLTNPLLTALMTPVTVTANSPTTIYTGIAYAGSVNYSVTPTPILGGTLSYSYLSGGVATTTPTNAGSYTVTPGGLLSNQQYLVSFASSNLVISPKPITVTNTASNTTYDGISIYANLMSTAGFTNTVLVGSDAIGSVTQSATIGSVPVSGVAQAGSFVSTPSMAVLTTGLASNYDFTYTPVANTVAQASLAITGITSLTGNTYNGGSYTSTYSTNLLGSDAISTSISGVVLQTNAGTYASNLGATGAVLSNYTAPVITNDNFVISPKPITVTNTASNTTYDGISTYANLMSTAGFTNTVLVGSDAIGSVTQSATIGSVPVSGVAQAGSFVSTPSMAVLTTGLASNYDFTYTPATNNVAQALLTTPTPLPAGDLSILSPLNNMITEQIKNSKELLDCSNNSDVHIGGVSQRRCDGSNIKMLGFDEDSLPKL